MNTLKIQIKPYYQNNPFNLKDDQIHCLSTNKDEEEIQLLLKQMNLSNRKYNFPYLIEEIQYS